MSILHPTVDPHPIHRIHRLGAAAAGGFLVLFGVLGVTSGLDFLSTRGGWIMGLGSNGLLSTISLVIGAVLVAAGLRGGPVASSTSIVVGALFLVSGLANVLVLDTSLNMLAFRLPNIFFSIGIGAALLFLGTYGRVSGRLPAGNPYAREVVPADPTTAVSGAQRRADAAADAEMAAAERAVACRAATSQQQERVRAVAAFRAHEDRRRAWQSFSPSA